MLIMAVKGVTLDKSPMSVVKTQAGALAATVNPSNAAYKSVVWSSSNTAVAFEDIFKRIKGFTPS